MRLPASFRPYPDELLSSWLERLAVANGIDSADYLLAFFHNMNRKQAIRALQLHGLVPQMERLASVLDCGMSSADILAQTTLAPAAFPFMSEGVYARYQSFLSSGYDEARPLPGLMFDLRYCETCRKEDVDRGRVPYLRRMHHINGIDCCVIHQTALRMVKTNEAVACNLSMGTNVYRRAFFINYSSFVNGILASGRIYSNADVKRAVEKRIDDLGFLTQADFNTAYPLNLEPVSNTSVYLALSRLVHGRNVDMTESLAVCAMLFHNFNNFTSYVERRKPYGTN